MSTNDIDIIEELFASDEASSLTNRAARVIERLRNEIERLEELVDHRIDPAVGDPQ